MSDDPSDLWYQLGHTLERLRLAPGEALDRGSRATARLADRIGGAADRASDDDGSDSDGLGLVRGVGIAGATSLALRLLRPGSGKDRPGVAALAAAGASGAGAAALTELIAPLLSSRVRPASDRRELGASLFTGAGRGLVYGGVVRPRVPGPAFLLGFLFGTAEYLAAERGGLARVLRSVSPHRRIPFVASLLEADPEDDPDYVEHLLFGLALALLYDVVGANSGTVDDE